MAFTPSVPKRSNGAPSSKNSNKQETVQTGRDVMARMDPATRMKLTTGKPIHIVDYKGEKFMDFPMALFKAATIKPELVVDDMIVLEDNLDIEQAYRFLSLLMKIPSMSSVAIIGQTENTEADLFLHSAAEYLGMAAFTQSIFDLYFKRVNNSIPTVPNIEAILRIRTPPGDKIFKQMSYNIGVKYYENKIANREAFEAYLVTQPRLHVAVMEVAQRKHNAGLAQSVHAKSQTAYAERERRREEKACRAQEEQQNQEYRKAKAEERQQKEAAVQKSMLAKKSTGQKMSAEEARAHEKVFGKFVAH